ncbi:hypothetical protein VU02_00490, partial [Desulfobulbus sp. N2]|nr:hypothetical protein [Desulfobulbus sp. N2]
QPGTAVTCWNIGTLYDRMGDLAKAEEYISRAVQIAEDIGHPELGTYRQGLEQVRGKRWGRYGQFSMTASSDDYQ